MCFFVPQVWKEEIGHSVVQDVYDLSRVKQKLITSFLVLIPNFCQNKLEMLNLEELFTFGQLAIISEVGHKV